MFMMFSFPEISRESTGFREILQETPGQAEDPRVPGRPAGAVHLLRGGAEEARRVRGASFIRQIRKCFLI